LCAYNVLPTVEYRDNPEGTVTPGKKHLRGVGAKGQRECERSGRYGGSAKEVAARTVMKQHKEKGHNPGK
jgi:hypothetical protein